MPLLPGFPGPLGDKDAHPACFAPWPLVETARISRRSGKRKRSRNGPDAGNERAAAAAEAAAIETGLPAQAFPAQRFPGAFLQPFLANHKVFD